MVTRAARAAAALRAAFVEVKSGVCGECVDALTDAQLVEWANLNIEGEIGEDRLAREHNRAAAPE